MRQGRGAPCRREQDATERALAAGDDHVAVEARAELGEPLGPGCGIPDLALFDLDLHEQLEQRGAFQTVLAHLSRASSEDRRCDDELAAGQVDQTEHVAGGGVVLEAVEQPRRLFDPALREAQFCKLREHLDVEARLGGPRHLLERGPKLSFRLGPLAGGEKYAAVVQAAENVDVGRAVAAVELVGSAYPARGAPDLEGAGAGDHRLAARVPTVSGLWSSPASDAAIASSSSAVPSSTLPVSTSAAPISLSAQSSAFGPGASGDRWATASASRP